MAARQLRERERSGKGVRKVAQMPQQLTIFDALREEKRNPSTCTFVLKAFELEKGSIKVLCNLKNATWTNCREVGHCVYPK